MNIKLMLLFVTLVAASTAASVAQTVQTNLQEYLRNRNDAKLAVTTSSSECPVCLDPMDGPDVTIKTQCGHLFHRKCVSRVLQTSGCPLCRRKSPEQYSHLLNLVSQHLLDGDAEVEYSRYTDMGANYNQLNIDEAVKRVTSMYYLLKQRLTFVASLNEYADKMLAYISGQDQKELITCGQELAMIQYRVDQVIRINDKLNQKQFIKLPPRSIQEKELKRRLTGILKTLMESRIMVFLAQVEKDLFKKILHREHPELKQDQLEQLCVT